MDAKVDLSHRQVRLPFCWCSVTFSIRDFLILFIVFPLGLKSSSSRSIAKQPSSKQHLTMSKRKDVYDVMQTATKRLSKEARYRKRQQDFEDIIEKELILSYVRTLKELRRK